MWDIFFLFLVRHSPPHLSVKKKKVDIQVFFLFGYLQIHNFLVDKMHIRHISGGGRYLSDFPLPAVWAAAHYDYVSSSAPSSSIPHLRASRRAQL